MVGDGIICDDWGYFSAPRTVTQSHFAAKGLTDASPFCDLPLLDFVYDEVSALLVHDFEGRYKELLRECQKGIVPESLRGRQNDTFVFNSFQLTYVNKAREYFASLLRTVPDGWIDQPGREFCAGAALVRHNDQFDPLGDGPDGLPRLAPGFHTALRCHRRTEDRRADFRSIRRKHEKSGALTRSSPPRSSMTSAYYLKLPEYFLPSVLGPVDWT